MNTWKKLALLGSALTMTAACAAPTDEMAEASFPPGTEDGVVATTSQALTSGLVASRQADGIVMSTGNIYFTAHDAGGAAVWRTAQSSSPGAEGVLYYEAGARFGDIVWAQVNGVYWGYFLARVGNVVTIRRVSLSGGSHSVLATISSNIDIANSHRNLVTDGVSLYWQDDVAVWRMPVGGGAPYQLDATSPNAPTAGLALSNGNVYYASGNSIYYVAVGGSITIPMYRVKVTATTRITTLYTVSNGIYWGEQSGAVRVRVGTTTTTLPSTNGYVPTSIGTNGYTAGAAQVWTQCAGSSCRLQYAFPAWSSNVAIAAGAFGAAVNSTGNVFWSDAAGIHRQVI